LGLVEGNTYIGLLVEESNTLLDWGNMVERETEAKSSGSGVTNPYHRTEHCDKIHAYRCDNIEITALYKIWGVTLYVNFSILGVFWLTLK
jgi:hypothetical protein